MHASNPSADTAARLIGKLVAERYRVEALVATGGMGAVYRAVDADGRAYAIKFLHPHVATETLSRRFLRESKLAESIDHPHIVPVVDAGQDDDVPFLVMPLLAGRDAGLLLADVGPLAPSVAVRIVVQACSGVAALHESGIIHRDIKPTNLFLATQPDGTVVVKVFDFGIAKEIGSLDHTQLTQTGTELGSPHYMSPEQARDAKQVDERSDVWSLAVTLYKLLSGKVPFDESAGLGHYLLSVATRDPKALQDHAPWIDPALARAIHAALVREPKRRCATVRELSASLAPFLEGSEELEVGDLRGATAAERARTAPRADLRDLYPSIELREAETSADALLGDRPKKNETLDRLVNKRLGGRWRVVRLLGRGGMGAVFEVHDDQGMRAAAKVISRQHFAEGEQTVRRFVREANASRAIDSPNVVRTLEVEQDSELASPFIVMELLEGIDLGSLFRQKAPIEPAPLVAAFVQAGRGLTAAHAQGIIHRDVKPGNLFLHVEPASGNVVVKVCDFGIAKRANPDGQFDQTSHELTQTGGMLGSPMYMSPEQAVNAKHVDNRTDVWSLAISLYEGLSGRKVWAGRTALGEILVAICTQQVPPLRNVAPWVDPRLAEVVHRGLEQQPLARWSSVEEMVAALEPFAQTGDLRLEDLVSVADELRAQVDLPPEDSPDRVAATSAGVERAPFNGRAATTTTTGEGTARRRTWKLAAGAALAAALATAAFTVANPSSALSQRLHLPWAESPAPPEGATAAAPEAPRVLRYTATVTIAPPDARVQVDGQPVEVVAGAIQIGGEPGQSFEVVVDARGTTQRARVMVTNEGKAMPDRVAVEAPAVAAAAASSAPVKGTPGRKPGAASGKGKPADTAAPAGDAPAPAPTATAATDPAKPSFKNAW